jgi:hypothetical protein
MANTAFSRPLTRTRAEGLADSALQLSDLTGPSRR